MGEADVQQLTVMVRRMWDTLRKFGLEYCDLPTLIWNVAVMLRVMALKIERGGKSIPKYSYVGTLACAVCYFFSYQVAVFYFVTVRCVETGDVLAAIVIISVSSQSLIGITKLLNLYILQDDVQSLVSGYLAYDAFPPSPGSAKVLVATMRRVKQRAMLSWSVLMMNSISYNLLPVAMPDRPEMYAESVVFCLEYLFGSTNYFLALVNVVTSVEFISFVAANIICFLIITTGYSEARLLALSHEIRELWTDAHQHYMKNFNGDYSEKIRDDSASKEMNNYIKQRLRNVAKSHAMNINLVKQLEAIFRNAMVLEFLLLALSFIADLLGGLENTLMLMPFAVLQVFMDCYVGQKLIDASAEFEVAVYDSSWERFDAENMKTVLVILKMSQRTLSLSAGGLSTLSYVTLMALYKSVYSAYTTLRSTML